MVTTRRYDYGAGRDQMPELLAPVVRRHLRRTRPERWHLATECMRTFGQNLEMLRARYFRTMWAAENLSAHSDPVFQEWAASVEGATDEQCRYQATDANQEREVSLDNLQYAFVDEAEGFYGSIYPTLSWFLRLLQLVEPDRVFRGIKLGSVRGFLDGCNRLPFGQDVCTAREVLQSAIHFRNEFLVHPRTEDPWTWMTLVLNGIPATAYFFYVTARRPVPYWPARRSLYPGFVSWPWDERLILPAENSGFVVPPHPGLTMIALVALVDSSLQLVTDAVESTTNLLDAFGCDFTPSRTASKPNWTTWLARTS